MSNSNSTRFHHFMVGSLSLMAMVFIGAVLLLWSWNTTASGLFQAPEMEFKHALAVELFLGVVFLISGTVSRVLMGGPHALTPRSWS